MNAVKVSIKLSVSLIEKCRYIRHPSRLAHEITLNWLLSTFWVEPHMINSAAAALSFDPHRLSDFFAELKRVDSFWCAWIETAPLCDPDTPRSASWRQRPSLSSAWTHAYKSTSAHWGCEAHHTNRGQCCNRTFASGNIRFASCSALWSISASWQCNLNWIHLKYDKKICGTIGQTVLQMTIRWTVVITIVFYVKEEKSHDLQWKHPVVLIKSFEYFPGIFLWWNLKLDKCYI